MSSGLDGLMIVVRYALGALNHNVWQRGPLPRHDLDDEDFTQEVHLALLERLGQWYGDFLTKALGQPPEKSRRRTTGSAHEALRKAAVAVLREAVGQALCRVRSTLDKRKQRGLPAELTYDLAELPQAAIRTAHYTVELVATLWDFDGIEREMIRQFAEGDSPEQIAATHGLTVKQVKKVRDDLIRRVGEDLELLGRGTM